MLRLSANTASLIVAASIGVVASGMAATPNRAIEPAASSGQTLRMGSGEGEVRKAWAPAPWARQSSEGNPPKLAEVSSWQASPLATRAEREYTRRCMACHGVTGEGDGPGAVALDPKPRSLRAPEWQNSVTDEDIAKATVDGGTAVGKSPVMPGFPELKGKPELEALVRLIRSFRD